MAAGEGSKPRKCPMCRGRGYHHCACWPADCICGYGDETCEACDGSGLLDPYEDDSGWEERPEDG